MGGLAVSADGRALYAAQVYGKARWRSTSRRARCCARRELPAEAYTAAARARRARALRVASGAARGSPCSTRRRSRRSPRSRSASTRTRCASRRTARACSWPAPTRTRSGSSTSPRGRRSSRSASRSRPKAPPGLDAERARALARRRHAARRERRQQHRRRRRRHAPGREPRSRASSPPAGIRPASPSTATGENVLVLSGKGLTPVAEPARPAARSPRARTRATSPAC